MNALRIYWNKLCSRMHTHVHLTLDNSLTCFISAKYEPNCTRNCRNRKKIEIMCEVWMQRNVRRPPLNIVGHKFENDPGTDCSHGDSFNCFNHCLSVFEIPDEDLELVRGAIALCEPMEVAISRLQTAAAMASRLIARRAQSFRVQPSFSHFRKMNVALCRLQELKMYSQIDGMKNAMNSSCRIGGAYHLPTVANIRYFLIRLQSYAKLLVRIVVCAKESHRLYLEILHRSAFVETITMFMAVTAQIWTECVAICQSVAQLYDAFFGFFKKYFVAEVHDGLPDHLSEWLGDEWTEHIAVKKRFDAKNTQKYQNNIILFNAFDVRPAKLVETMETDADGNEATEQKPSTPKFTPKFIINNGLRPMNLNDPNKLSRAQQHQLKHHQKQEKIIEKNLHRKINRIQQQEKKIQLRALEEPSAVKEMNASSTVDMGEKIDRDAFRTQNKIVKIDKLKQIQKVDVNNLNSVAKIREFMVTEELLRQKRSAQASHGVSNMHWRKVKSSVDQLLILGQEKMIVRKFRTLWQNVMQNNRPNPDSS